MAIKQFPISNFQFSKLAVIICLIVILGIAVFFRVWQLESIPPGLYPDEAINGNQAISEPRKIFYPENNGREGLFINLIFLSFSIFSVSIWSIKIVAAIMGILTVLGIYLLTKELFVQCNEARPRYIALLSSFFLATSFWHMNFSRIGFRGILVPFILVFSFYFLFRGFRTQKTSNFILAGIFFGLGFYTYISFRLTILLLFIVLLCWWFISRKQDLSKKFIIHTSYFLILTFIVALPIGIYFFQNPGDFISRTTEVSIFAQQNPIKAFGESLGRHLAMFNFSGDFNWRHNFAGSPMLLWPIGILFLVGIGISIKKIVGAVRKKNYLLFTIHCLLLSWFFIMLLPGILTYEGIPHALRTIGVIPVVYIFTGLGGWWVYEQLKKIIKNKKLLISLCLLFLISVTYGQFCKYFLNWAKNPEVEGAFSKNYLAIGNYLNSLPPEIQKYVIVNQLGVPVPWPDGIPMPAQTVMFIERTKFNQPQSTYLLPEDLNQIKIKKKTVIIPMRYDQNLFNEFSQKFPQGKSQKENDIWFYKINF